MARTTLLILLALGIGCSAGCNQGETVPVEGMVTLDGQPFQDVHVMFHPEAADPSNQALYFGLTDQEGRFALRNSIDGGEGVPPGKYHVTLTTAVAGQEATETTPLPPERVPPKHRKKEIDVTADGSSDIKFELTSR
jgi:hypothetical protein